MSLPDLVYIVRPDEPNEELRYSLRSAAQHLPHRYVWIVGTVPPWYDDLTLPCIELHPKSEKFANQRQSLSAACNHPHVSDTFVLMNDDHFVIEPVQHPLPTFHLGPISGFKFGQAGPSNTWRRAVSQTATWMASQGFSDPLAYEAHVPLLFYKSKLADVLDAYPTNKRFAAGMVYEMAGAGPIGTKAGNAKVRGLGREELDKKLAHPMPYLSTNDYSFANGVVGEWVRTVFNEPCRYEAGGS